MNKIQTHKKLRATAFGFECGTPAFPLAELPADPADPLNYIKLFLIYQILRELCDGFFHIILKFDPVPSLA